LKQDEGTDRWASALVDIEELGDGRWRLRQLEGVKPLRAPMRIRNASSGKKAACIRI